MSKKSGGIYLPDISRNRLKTLIHDSPLTREEIVSEIGFGSAQQLSYFISDKKSKRRIYPETLRGLARVFGVSVAYILGESDYKTEREEKIATVLRAADSAVVKKSTIYALLSLSGYELSAVYSPFVSEDAEAKAAGSIADFLEVAGGGEFISDSGVTYEFINPSGKTVYVPVENFIEAEEMIEDFAQMTFRHMFDNWSGVQSAPDSPPEGLRRAVDN